ncbi:MAG: hypothetical protein LBQ15_02845 [Clostridium sp.]|nr:hypothetical protein [Clostridium sp.]
MASVSWRLGPWACQALGRSRSSPCAALCIRRVADGFPGRPAAFRSAHLARRVGRRARWAAQRYSPQARSAPGSDKKKRGYMVLSFPAMRPGERTGRRHPPLPVRKEPGSGAGEAP